MFASVLHHPRLPIRVAQQLGLGFGFWLVFLLVLQSGNAARSSTAGFGEETARILTASALGSLSALLLAPLTARFPLRSPRWLTHLAVQLSAGGLIAVTLVLVASVAAPLVLSPGNPRLTAPLLTQLAADAPLLTFAILGFALLLQWPAPGHASADPAPAAIPSGFTVKARQGLVRVEAAEIDWVESQENYVALHCGSETYLVRETLTAVAERLDPEAFLRIHRRIVVNLARIRALRALPGGDATVVLVSSAELRVSRTYAASLREAVKRTSLPSQFD